MYKYSIWQGGAPRAGLDHDICLSLRREALVKTPTKYHVQTLRRDGYSTLLLTVALMKCMQLCPSEVRAGYRHVILSVKPPDYRPHLSQNPHDRGQPPVVHSDTQHCNDSLAAGNSPGSWNNVQDCCKACTSRTVARQAGRSEMRRGEVSARLIPFVSASRTQLDDLDTTSLSVSRRDVRGLTCVLL